jgi:hypothetical protein
VVHDFVGWGGKYIPYPTFNKPFVKVATTAMSHRVIPRPTVNGDSVTNNKPIVARPTGTKRLHVRVTGFEVNCNLLSVG